MIIYIERIDSFIRIFSYLDSQLGNRGVQISVRGFTVFQSLFNRFPTRHTHIYYKLPNNLFIFSLPLQHAELLYNKLQYLAMSLGFCCRTLQGVFRNALQRKEPMRPLMNVMMLAALMEIPLIGYV